MQVIARKPTREEPRQRGKPNLVLGQDLAGPGTHREQHADKKSIVFSSGGKPPKTQGPELDEDDNNSVDDDDDKKSVNNGDEKTESQSS